MKGGKLTWRKEKDLKKSEDKKSIETESLL